MLNSAKPCTPYGGDSPHRTYKAAGLPISPPALEKNHTLCAPIEGAEANKKTVEIATGRMERRHHEDKRGG